MKQANAIKVLTVMTLISISCGGGNKKATTGNMPAVPQKARVETAGQAIQTPVPGEDIYRKACLTCHQADGSGVPGMYPPLNHAEKIMGPSRGLIKVILFGQKGPAVINGQTYRQQMPPQKLLNDSTVAVLVNYVKKTWGDVEGTVTAEDVRKIRAAGNH
jgi:mono/diheme cytochrome c family protein